MSEPPTSKPRTWTGQIVGIFVVLAVILWFIQMRRAPMQLLERRDCQNAYAAARTAADSAAVDLRQPLGRDRPRGSGQLTCGHLRRAGLL